MTATTGTPKRLFVLMPFGDGRKLPRIEGQDSPVTCNFDQWFEKILKPAGIAAGFEVIRADKELLGGEVMGHVWKELKKADAVLAFLTGLNPNVFYELGLAHCRRKPVFLIADRKEHIPFDVNHLRVFQYDDTEVDKVGRYRPEILERLTALYEKPEEAVLKLFDK